MTDSPIQEMTMEELLNEEKRVARGQVVTGEILQIGDDEITIDVGYKTEGVIPRSEFLDVEGFFHVFRDMVVLGELEIIGLLPDGEHHDGHRSGHLADGGDGFESVHARHADVGEDEVDFFFMGFELLDGLHSVRGG